MKCKKNIDYRILDRDTKETIRISVVKRIKEGGESPEDVAKGMDINRRTIYRWLKLYKKGGIEALKKKPIRGATPKLNEKQIKILIKIIRDEDPEQRKFKFALWTLSMIRCLIYKLFNVHMRTESVGRLMKRLGFSPQRPLYRAWQQNPELVKKWKNEEYPKIAKRARREKGLIFFADESAVKSNYHSGTTWAPIGNTPIIKSTGARYSLNIISAVNSKGHFRFMTVDGRMTAKKFIDFLKKMIKGVPQKIFLIVDGHPTHKAKMVKKFVGDNKNHIELFYLPPYSPELNPDELAWAHLKAEVAKQVPLTLDDLKKMVYSSLKKLQKLPEIVSSFFKIKTCRYSIL